MWRTGAGQTIGPNGDSTTNRIGSQRPKDDMTATHDDLQASEIDRWETT